MVEKLTTTGQGDWWPDLVEPFRALGNRIHDFFSPQAEAGATDEAYEIELEIPGVEENDIEISHSGDVITIKGEKHAARKEEGKTYYFSERVYGAFQRSFRLPGDVDAEGIEAAFKNGVLKLRLPKRAGSAETTRRIDIKTH
jgi:HSP20 family protein